MTAMTSYDFYHKFILRKNLRFLDYLRKRSEANTSVPKSQMKVIAF